MLAGRRNWTKQEDAPYYHHHRHRPAAEKNIAIDFGGGLKAESDLKLKQKIKYMLHGLFKISLSLLGLGLLTP